MFTRFAVALIAGLALVPVHAGTLYLADDQTNSLVSVDTDTLAFTTVGPFGVPYQFGGLAYDPNTQTLYMIGGRGNNNLYTVDVSTGAATLVGAHGINDLFGLAFDSTNNRLYGSQFSSGDGFYELSTVNGSATLIGNPGRLGGLAYDSDADRIIGISDGSGQLYEVDRVTGVWTLLASPGGTNDSGLAFDPDLGVLWDADFSGNFYSYDVAGGFTRTTEATGLNQHTGAAYESGGSGSVDLSITKTAPATAVAGTQITYTVDVSNSLAAVRPIPGNFIDISGTGTPVPLGDDALSGDLPVGFTFDYLGQSKTTVRISSNGFLTFAPETNNGCCTGDPIPDPQAPNEVIALYWEDLDPGNGGVGNDVLYETIGTAPNRIFIAQYDDVEHFPSGNRVTAQVLLYEGSNDIEFQYLDAPSDGGTHSVGFENVSGTAGIEIARGNISFANEGFLIEQSSTATGVTVTDTLPSGATFVSATGCTNAPAGPVVSCVLPDLAAGQTANATITVAIDASFTGTLDNTATVAGDQADSDPANDSSTASTLVGAESDMSITKTGPAAAIAGAPVTYDITVTNNGPSDATSVSVADPTPPGYTFVSATAPCAGGFPCALGNIAAAGSAAFSVTYAIDPSAGGATVTNTATVSSATTDPNGGNNSASATTTIGAEADLAVTKAGPASAIAGGQVTYTLTVTNNGPSDAAAVTLDDPAPAGFTFNAATAPCAGGFPCALGTLAPSAVVSVDVTFDVDPSTVGDVVNTATVSSPTTDPNGANDSASVTTSVGADADLSIIKTVDTDVVQQGDTVIYTLTVSNAGPSDATNVVVTDNLPTQQMLVATSGCLEDPLGAPTCSLGTVPAGATVAVTLSAVVERATGIQTNVATVSSDTTDPVGTNNEGSVRIATSFAIPTLGTWGLIAMALVLMLIGGAQLRRML